jgi:integrase
LGLKWTDLDDNRLHVQRSLSRRDGAGWELKEPKTTRSRRVVPLPVTAVRVLAQHKVRQAEERLKAGPAYADHGLIFATRMGEPLDYRVVVKRHFKRVLDRAGLGSLRPYDLRHTCATLLLKAREHPKVVSERLGHSSIVMTLETYSHVLPDMQQRAADQLESLLFGQQAEAAS